MSRFIIFICFYFPLVSSCLNFQGLIRKFVSVSLSQYLAYLNICFIIIGIFFFRKKIGELSNTNKLWIIFYIVYYCFALLASGINGFDTTIMATLVAPIYFTGFFFLLSSNYQYKIFIKVLTICLVISSFFTIYFFKINFSYDVSGIIKWQVDRAEGLYGDANNAALTGIISYILFNKFFNPTKRILIVLKSLILLVIIYSIFLTFSTTGLFTLLIIFFITKYKYFTGLKFLLLGIIIILFYIGIFLLKTEKNDLDLSSAQIAKVDNFINVVTLNTENVNSSGRTDLLDNIIYHILENPILGNGVNFGNAARGHNTYLGVWVDAGLFTFLYFVYVLLYYLKKTFLLNLHLKLFTMSILITLYIFMLSLQTVINQPYLVVLFVFIGYFIDNNIHKDIEFSSDNKNIKISNTQNASV